MSYTEEHPRRYSEILIEGDAPLSDCITESGSTPNSLLSRVKSSDREAWFSFCELYAPLVYFWVKSSGVSIEDTEDLVQQVFGRVSQTLHRFEKKEAGARFRAWLWTLTRNLILDFRRAQNRRIRMIGGEFGESFLAVTPENIESDEETPSKEIHQLFLRMLNQLRDRYAPRNWQAFWKVVVEGQLTSEVAEELQMNVNSVRQAKSRILRQLRQEFGEFLE